MVKKISFSYLIIRIFPRARDGVGGGGRHEPLYLQSGCGICRRWKLALDKGKFEVNLSVSEGKWCVRKYIKVKFTLNMTPLTHTSKYCLSLV